MSVRQDYWQFCDLLVRNAGEETIPPFACMQVVGYESIRMDDGDVKIGFKVKKPDGKGKVYLINSPAEIAPGRPGDATNAYGMFVLYSGTLPTESETNANGLKEWGPKSGSWAIDQDGKGFVIIGQDGGEPASEPGFPPSASTKRVRVAIQPAPKSVELATGLLIKDLPAATPSISGATVKLTPGFADEAVIPLTWEKVGTQDELTAEKTESGALVKLPALNTIWPTIVKAAETSKGCVIVKGVKETRAIYTAGNPRDELVFVVHEIAYPVTIVAGRVSSSVQGGNWIQSVTKVLWGRDPGVTNINVENPDGWTGPAQGYAVAIRMIDGNWYGIDLRCA